MSASRSLHAKGISGGTLCGLITRCVRYESVRLRKRLSVRITERVEKMAKFRPFLRGLRYDLRRNKRRN